MSFQMRDRRRGAALVTVFAFAFLVLGAPAVGAAVGQASVPQAGQSLLVINHDALACVNTEMAPLVDAQVAPAPQFERGYVYFKAAGTEDFYYTPMKGAPENLEGILPRPLPETRAIDYKLRARDVEALTKETPEYVPPVVSGNVCKAKGMVVGKEGAGLTIGLTREGQNPVPPGFNKRDIAFIILFSGATVALAAALKGAGGAVAAGGAKTGGGGISTGVAVAGGVVVAGAAAAVIASNKGSSNTATPQPTTTPTPTRTPTPTPTPIPPRFVEADALWSGAGDIDLQILNADGQAVGTTLPAGCESMSQRIERVLLQGVVPDGTYRVMLTARTCGAGTPSTIAVALSVLSNSGPKCANSFLSIGLGQTVLGCQFTLP
jgi:hypothetical protein